VLLLSVQLKDGNGLLRAPPLNLCACTHAHVCQCTHNSETLTLTPTHTHARRYLDMHLNTPKHLYTHAHTPTHTHTHTHTHHNTHTHHHSGAPAKHRRVLSDDDQQKKSSSSARTHTRITTHIHITTQVPLPSTAASCPAMTSCKNPPLPLPLTSSNPSSSSTEAATSHAHMQVRLCACACVCVCARVCVCCACIHTFVFMKHAQCHIPRLLTLTNTCLGWAKTIYIHGVYTVILAGKSPNIRSHTVYIYGSGQPYTCQTDLMLARHATLMKCIYIQTHNLTHTLFTNTHM